MYTCSMEGCSVRGPKKGYCTDCFNKWQQENTAKLAGMPDVELAQEKTVKAQMMLRGRLKKRARETREARLAILRCGSRGVHWQMRACNAVSISQKVRLLAMAEAKGIFDDHIADSGNDPHSPDDSIPELLADELFLRDPTDYEFRESDFE